MRQSLCQLPPWCHGLRSLRNLVVSTTMVVCNDIAHLSLPGDIVHVKVYLKYTRCCLHLRIFIQRPKAVESSKKTAGFPMLPCLDGIQAVSLGSFVQGIVAPSCFRDNTRGAKTAQSMGFFWVGIPSVGVSWLEFSGQNSKPLSNLVEHIEAQNNQQVFYYDF